MNKPRVPLYNRLPEIYRTKDADNQYQLKGYLSILEEMFSEIHKNIEGLYDDLFIESCAEWVIPYIGDLLGAGRLKGDPWTIRADVAQTIKLRRRKGTIRAIELLTYNLSGWGVHCVELRKLLLWNQHLNHQRPDAGGAPPYADPSAGEYFIDQKHRMIPQGGTMPIRNSALLSLAGGPFDPFAHTVDVKPATFGQLRYNIPNLAIYFRRCRDYRLTAVKPAHVKTITINENNEEETTAAKIVGRLVCFSADQSSRPVRLFNNGKFNFDEHTGERSDIESMPGPLPLVWLPGGGIFADASDFCFIDSYDADAANDANPATKPLLDAPFKAFGVHIPKAPFLTPPGATEAEDKTDDAAIAEDWSFRAASLCDWNNSLNKPLAEKDIAVDPCSGRFMARVNTTAEATALENHLRVTYTYGAPGPVGAHPISREAAPKKWLNQETANFDVSSSYSLQEALNAVMAQGKPAVINIKDSEVHALDLAEITLRNSLIIRAADSKRPIISLGKPLKFRPFDVPDPESEDYNYIETLTVRLEGLFISRNGVNELIAQAAVHRLEIIDSTLDPGGFLQDDGSRAPHFPSLTLDNSYGLSGTDEINFDEIPEIIIENSISGALLIDKNCRLFIENSIIDGGQSPSDAAIAAPTDENGPDAEITGATLWGSVSVESIFADGAIFRDDLTVHNDQQGCVKFSYLAGKNDRLPQNHACARGTNDPQKEAKLIFNSEIFGRHTYGQLHYGTDQRIREEGPGEDAMGVYGFLLETHKLKNIQTRYREYMPAGVRPLLIPADNLDSCIKRTEI